MAFKILNCLVQIEKNFTTDYAVKGDVYEFVEATTITTEESYELPINTATITVAKGIDFLDLTSQPRDANEIFSIGDSVKIVMWYQRTETDEVDNNDYTSDNRKAIFTGYIAEITAGDKITIKCEDEMWKFKQVFLNFPGQVEAGKSYEFQVGDLKDEDTVFDPKKVMLSNVVNYYTNKVDIDVVDGHSFRADTTVKQLIDVELGPFKKENSSFIQIINELTKTYNILGYYRNQNLYIGTYAVGDNFIRNIQFTFGIDILNDKNLKFQTRENVLIKVSVVAIFPNLVVKKLIQNKDGTFALKTMERDIEIDANQKAVTKGKTPDAEYFIGDKNGSLRTFFLYFSDPDDPTIIETMRDAGENELNRYKYTGWKGSFETFGEFVVYPGDSVDLFDKRLSRNQTDLTDPIQIERNGEYLVRSVKRIYDASSPKFHQIIELGPKL